MEERKQLAAEDESREVGQPMLVAYVNHRKATVPRALEHRQQVTHAFHLELGLVLLYTLTYTLTLTACFD